MLTRDLPQGNLAGDAQESVPAACEHDGARRGIAQGSQQLVEAAGIRSRQVPRMAGVHALAEAGLETHALQRAHAALEAVAVERAGGRHDGDAVTFAQRGGAGHGRESYPKAPAPEGEARWCEVRSRRVLP